MTALVAFVMASAALTMLLGPWALFGCALLLLVMDAGHGR